MSERRHNEPHPQTGSHRVGFIGLGSLGQVLASNLIARGHVVFGYRRGPIDAFVEMGGVACRSPAEVAANAEVLMTCLPSAESLEQVVAGPSGFFGRPGQLPDLVEMSTLALDAKQRLAARLAERGAAMLDCPISGIPPQVAERKGMMLASGSEADFVRWRGLLSDLLGKVVYCGTFGNGLKVKYVANYLVGVHTWAALEATALAEALGLDPLFVAETLKGGAASSSQYEMRAGPVSRRERPPPYSTSRNLIKDLLIIRDMAHRTGLGRTLIDDAIPRYEEVIASGYGDEDIVRIIELFDRRRADLNSSVSKVANRKGSIDHES